MEHKDATPMNNKLEYIESDFDMEDIVLKPSVELIPDEYEHTDNKAALVHIFRGEYKHDVINTERVRLSLQKLGYDIPFENVHFIRKRKQVQEDLDEIANNTEGKSSLLILFLDVYKEHDKLMLHEEPNDYLTTRDIWINFTGYKCPNLRNKPKIFIFQATKYISNIQYDSVLRTNMNYKNFYKVPAEADILIVYKMVEEDLLKRKFIQDFCNNIDKNGERDDILTLITQTEHPNNVKTLVISTLTKKFYFTPSNVRGHHWDLRTNHVSIQEALGILHKRVGDVLAKSTNTTAKAESSNSIKKVNSFRASNTTESDSARSAKSEAKPVTVKKTAKKTSTEKPPWRY